MRAAGDTEDATGRRRHDAAVAASHHVRPRGAHDVERARQVVPHRVVELARRHLGEVAVPRHPGVRDDDIERAGLLDDRSRAVFGRHVGDHDGNAQVVGGGLRRIGIDVVDDHSSTVRDQHLRVRAPQTASGTGDERDATVEPGLVVHRRSML